jgi:phage terminase large subunit
VLKAANKPLDPWQAAWITAAKTGDALLFATGVLRFLMPGEPNPNNAPQLEPWQVTALQKFSKAWQLRFVKKGRISIRSGHGVGKTMFLAILVLFVMFCAGLDVKIPVVANSQDQLRDGLWPEIRKWIGHLPKPLQDQIDWQAERVVLKAAPEEVFATARTASKHRPEALAGMHATTVLAIFEEASGIPEETFETSSGALSTPGAMAVAVGNGTRASGFFHATHHRLKDEWDTMKVSSEDVPRARGHISDIVNLYGKDSNKYRVRVLGEFPLKDDDTVIPLDWVESARGRKVAKTPFFPIWGVDVARFGDDRSVLIRREGNYLLGDPTVWKNVDIAPLAYRIRELYDETPNHLKPKAICIDPIGVGAGVASILKMPGSPVATLIREVNVSEKASDGERFMRSRDELWFKGREWFATKAVCFPTEGPEAPITTKGMEAINDLIAELTTPTYDFSIAGKIVVQSKEDMKKEGLRSPDLADAFLLTFGAGAFPRPVGYDDVHRAYEPAGYNDPWTI